MQLYQQRNYNAYDIYLMTDEWDYKMRPDSLENETGDRKQYVEEDSEDSSMAEQFCNRVEEEFAEFINGLVAD